MKSAIRRAHRERIQRKRRSYWGGDVADPARLGKIAKTPCVCSSWCCGNPRRHFGLPTMQERRAEVVR